MSAIYFHCAPFDKTTVTMALESGVDGVIVPRENMDSVAALARCDVFAAEDTPFVDIAAKADEEAALARMKKGEKVILASGWEVIPVENLLAQTDAVWAEAENLEKARLASGILEHGVAGIVVPQSAVTQLKAIISACKIAQAPELLTPALITSIAPAGLGHRVCIDTMSILRRGQGMLTGNSSAFTFLVHAETEHNEYVASRPFRVNAGAAHAYVRLPHDRTTYLEELRAGNETLVVDATGATSIATIGRVKIEVRPMLLIEAEAKNTDGQTQKGAIFLQNAETIRLTSPQGLPISVVKLKPGDEVLCRLDQAGRHFGMRVAEEIREA